MQSKKLILKGCERKVGTANDQILALSPQSMVEVSPSFLQVSHAQTRMMIDQGKTGACNVGLAVLLGRFRSCGGVRNFRFRLLRVGPIGHLIEEMSPVTVATGEWCVSKQTAKQQQFAQAIMKAQLKTHLKQGIQNRAEL